MEKEPKKEKPKAKPVPESAGVTEAIKRRRKNAK